MTKEKWYELFMMDWRIILLLPESKWSELHWERFKKYSGIRVDDKTLIYNYKQNLIKNFKYNGTMDKDNKIIKREIFRLFDDYMMELLKNPAYDLKEWEDG